MLRCTQCHSTTQVDPANPPMPNVADTQSLAPNLTLAKIRLRHDWIADWIRRPGRDHPRHPHADELPARPGDGRLPLAAGDGHRYAAVRRAEGGAAAVLRERRSAAQDDGRCRRPDRLPSRLHLEHRHRHDRMRQAGGDSEAPASCNTSDNPQRRRRRRRCAATVDLGRPAPAAGAVAARHR